MWEVFEKMSAKCSPWYRLRRDDLIPLAVAGIAALMLHLAIVRPAARVEASEKSRESNERTETPVGEQPYLDPSQAIQTFEVIPLPAGAVGDLQSGAVEAHSEPENAESVEETPTLDVARSGVGKGSSDTVILASRVFSDANVEARLAGVSKGPHEWPTVMGFFRVIDYELVRRIHGGWLVAYPPKRDGGDMEIRGGVLNPVELRALRVDPSGVSDVVLPITDVPAALRRFVKSRWPFEGAFEIGWLAPSRVGRRLMVITAITLDEAGANPTDVEGVFGRWVFQENSARFTPTDIVFNNGRTIPVKVTEARM